MQLYPKILISRISGIANNIIQTNIENFNKEVTREGLPF